MTHFLPYEKPVRFLILFILITVPLLFGAVHPGVQGFYTLLLLLGIGSWLVYKAPVLQNQPPILQKSLIVPVIILSYLAFLSLPLPVSILKVVSPMRAESIEMVNTLAGTNLGFASLSYNGMICFQRTLFLFSLLLYFLALSILFNNSKKFVSLVILILVLIGTLEALYGLLQVLNPKIGMLWLPIQANQAHGTIIYKNQYASFLNMCWPFALGAISRQAQKQERKEPYQPRSQNRRQLLSRFISGFTIQSCLYFFSIILMMLAVLFSYSRGGILSMAFIFIFLIVFFPFSTKKKMVVFSLLLLILFFYSSQLGIETLILRFQSIEHSAMTRFDIVKASLPIIKDHPLTGIGLGSYSYISDIYINFSQRNVLYDRVHNEFVELTIEMGIPIAFLFFSCLLYRLFTSGKALLIKRNFNKMRTQSQSFIGIAAFAALLGFLLHGVVDFGWHLPANTIYFVTLMALIPNSLRSEG